jgi:hypothetical protein
MGRGGIDMNDEIEKLLKTESKKIVRQPIAKVKIMWAGNGVDLAHAEKPASDNRASIYSQVVKGIGTQKRWAFCQTVENSVSSATLADGIYPMPDVTEEGSNAGGFLVGWWGDGQAIQKSGGFDIPQVLQIRFAPTNITEFRLFGYLCGDAEKQEWPLDFEVQAFKGVNYEPCLYSDGSLARVRERDNHDVKYSGKFQETLSDVTQLQFTIYNLLVESLGRICQDHSCV